MAARAGAQTITTCEMSRPLAEVARKVIEKNGFADRIRVINKKSTQLKLASDLLEPVDVLIAEVFDNGLLVLGEHFLPALIHAKKNRLKENATIIPAAATVYAMPIECLQLRLVNPIRNVAGFDLSDFDIFRNTGYKQVNLSNIEYRALGEPIDVLRIDFEGDTATNSRKNIEIEINKKGLCQTIAL